MKHRTPLAAGRLLAFVVVATAATSAGAGELSLSADAALNSKYVWRGILLTDGAVLQPALTLGAAGASVNVWGNIDLADANGNSGEPNELDYTVDYTFAAGDRASVSVGAVAYTFPNTTFDTTTELYAGASFDVPGSPSVTVYRDVDEADGLYATLAAGHGVPLPGGRTLDLGFTLGFGDADHNAFYYGSGEGGVVDLLVTVGATFDIHEGFSVTPAVAFAAALGHARDALDAAGIDATNAVVGVTASWIF